MITLNALPLPQDLVWTDEFAWGAQDATQTYTLTGALIVQRGTRQAGRPITLTGADNSAWIPRGTLLALRALADADAAYTLALHDGRQFLVRFRDPPLDAASVVDYSNPGSDDWYRVTLNLYTV